MDLCQMIDDLEDLVVEAYEAMGAARQEVVEQWLSGQSMHSLSGERLEQAERDYRLYNQALEVLCRRRDDLGLECITANVFTLEDAIHCGASVSEIFYGGNNTDGDDLDDGEHGCLGSMCYDAACHHQFQRIGAVA